MKPSEYIAIFIASIIFGTVLYGDDNAVKIYKLKIMKAEVYEKNKDYENANITYEKMKREYADDTSQMEIGSRSAFNKYRNGKYKEAINEYKILLDKYSGKSKPFRNGCYEGVQPFIC